MKKKILAPLLGAVVLSLGAYFGYHTYDAYAGTNESDMLLANVEALATDGEISYKTCTRPGITYRCISDRIGMFVCMRISTVEVYTVAVGSPIICQSAKVSSCPSGSHQA